MDPNIHIMSNLCTSKMCPPQVRSVHSVHELLAEYEKVFSELLSELGSARSARESALRDNELLRRRLGEGNGVGPQPASPLNEAGKIVASTLPGPPHRSSLQETSPLAPDRQQSMDNPIQPSAWAAPDMSSIGDDRPGTILIQAQLPLAAVSTAPPPSLLPQSSASEWASPTSSRPAASSATNPRAGGTDVMMTPPQHPVNLQQQQQQQWEQQHASLPGLPSSSAPVALAGGQASRRGWLGWLGGSNPKKPRRQALL